jgi:hypothetical protein
MYLSLLFVGVCQNPLDAPVANQQSRDGNLENKGLPLKMLVSLMDSRQTTKKIKCCTYTQGTLSKIT